MVQNWTKNRSTIGPKNGPKPVQKMARKWSRNATRSCSLFGPRLDPFLAETRPEKNLNRGFRLGRNLKIQYKLLRNGDWPARQKPGFCGARPWSSGRGFGLNEGPGRSNGRHGNPPRRCFGFCIPFTAPEPFRKNRVWGHFHRNGVLLPLACSKSPQAEIQTKCPKFEKYPTSESDP